MTQTCHAFPPHTPRNTRPLTLQPDLPTQTCTHAYGLTLTAAHTLLRTLTSYTAPLDIMLVRSIVRTKSLRVLTIISSLVAQVRIRNAPPGSHTEEWLDAPVAGMPLGNAQTPGQGQVEDSGV